MKKPVKGTESKATPYFDQKGAGNQVQTQKKIGKLTENGTLEHVGSQ